MNLTWTKRRLKAWIGLLSAENIAVGRTWYFDAHTFCVEVSRRYEVPLERVVGVLACLSVQNRWDQNKKDCEALVKAHCEFGDGRGVSVGTYSIQKEKACRILETEFDMTDQEISEAIATRYGPKTRAFFDNILHPLTSFRVTIDRWILRGLKIEFSGGAGNQYVAVYRHLEEIFRQCALEEGLRPCELQAAVWVAIQETSSRENWEGSRPTYKAEEIPF